MINFLNSILIFCLMFTGVPVSALTELDRQEIPANYVLNNGAEEAHTKNWAAYADAAAATPVDGTGGSPNVTITRSTSSPLRQNASFLITKGAANRQGEGVAYTFTIPSNSTDLSSVLTVSYRYSSSANYTTPSAPTPEYMSAYLYDVTNSVLITPSDTVVPAGTGTQTFTFKATTGTSYRLIFHVASSNTSSWTYKVDDLRISNEKMVQGPIVSLTEDISGVSRLYGAGNGTTLTNTTEVVATMQRVVDRAVFNFEYNFTGTPGGGTGVIRIKISNNLQIDTTKANSGFDHSRGIGAVYDATDSKKYDLRIQPSNVSGEIEVGIVQIDGSTGNANDFSLTSPITLANGDKLSLSFSLPIAGWTGGAQYANSGVEYACNSNTSDDSDDTTSFYYGADGCSVPQVGFTNHRNKRIRWARAPKPTDTIQFQFYDFNGPGWQALTAFNTITQPLYRAGGAYYGMGGLIAVNSTDWDVKFGEYIREGVSTWGGAGTSWSGTSASYKWRVVKYSNAIPVGMESRATAAYLFPAAAGYGATNTAIPYYNTITSFSDPKGLLSVGNSTTFGLSVTANRPCMVTMTFPMGYTGTAEYKGITKNSNQLTTTIDSVTAANVVAKTFSASNTVTTVTATVPMDAGDVLRPHLATGLTLNGYMLLITAVEL